MNNNELLTFIAVAKSGSFSLAAEQLFLTQPAVSKRIALLEHDLNTQLFDRLGRQVILTEAGQLFLKRAETIAHEIEDCRREISNLSGQISGSLTIATSHHIGLHRLPPVLRYFVSRYPEAKLDLHFMDSESAGLWVKNGQAELAIITLPTDPVPNLNTHTVWVDDLTLVAGKSHPLNSHSGEQAMTLQQISRYPGILPLSGTSTRSLVDAYFQRSGCELHTHMDTNFLETIKMLVSVGLGWSVLPHTLLDKDLLTLHVPQFSLQRQLGVVWHSARTLTNAAQTMIDTLGSEKSTKHQLKGTTWPEQQH